MHKFVLEINAIIYNVVLKHLPNPHFSCYQYGKHQKNKKNASVCGWGVQGLSNNGSIKWVGVTIGLIGRAKAGLSIGGLPWEQGSL